MHSNLHTDDPPDTADEPGILYVVATPIGNKEDITLRALNTFREVDFILAEDTRKTGRFLANYNIKNSLVSYHEHNENERTPGLVKKLKKGMSMALVSDAGTPTVSDPGYILIHQAIANSIDVIPIPGVSAAITALSVSGLPSDSFVFVGFASKKKKKRMDQLHALSKETRTLIFYESPRRILSFLEDISDAFGGDRHAVFSREMTKMHEEFIRGTVCELVDLLKKRPTVKGECVLIVSGTSKHETISIETITKEISLKLEANKRISDLAKELALKYQIPKSRIYHEALKLSGKKGK